MAKYDLNVAFRNWPLPGAKPGGGAVQRVCYPYNPRFVNGGNPPYYGISKRGLLLGAQGFDITTGDWPNPPFTVLDFCDGATESYEWYTASVTIIGTDIIGGQPESGTKFTASLNYIDGAKSDRDNWVSGVAGSVRAPRLLYGKQYWEVEIIKLPVDVPPPFTDSFSFSVPSPVYGTPPSGGTYIIDLPYGTIGYEAGGRYHIAVPNPDAGSITQVDSDVHFFHSAADGGGGTTINRGVSFPPSLNTFFNPVIGLCPLDSTFSQNDLIGLDNPATKTRSIGMTRTSVMMGQETNQGVVINHLYGDHWFIAPDITTDDVPEESLDIQSGKAGVCLPFSRALPGLHETVYGSPVFKGRADRLASIKTSGVDLGPTATNNGVWTGADLGALAINDVIMMATDCTSRKVWFGKNGTWIGPNGGAADPVAGIGYACLMDGIADKRNYYPGASYRYGPTHLRFLFRRDQFTYAPPSGFLPYDFWLNNSDFAPSLPSGGA